MLGLKLPTDRRWAELAHSNLTELLIDHAYCEQKAASNAISLILQYPELDELVQTMAQIAQEEMDHFARVHQLLLDRGQHLGPVRKDDYVNELAKFTRRSGPRLEVLADRLLFAAMVEARSCERFKLLSTEVPDAALAQFYHELMVSEATHYTTFIKLAHKYCSCDEQGRPAVDVDARWQQLLAYEAEVIVRYGQSERMHG